MKKVFLILSIIGKILLLILIWAAGIAIIDQFTKSINSFGKPTSVFLYEFLPFIAITLAHLMMLKFFERSTFSAVGLGLQKVATHSAIGIGVGALWFGLVLIGLSAVASVIYRNEIILSVAHLSIYFGILYFNAFMQELLVHGYAFYLIKKNAGQISALIITSFLFLMLHPAAINSGIIASINVFGAGLIFGLLLLYFDNLWAAVSAHAAWNYLGSVWFGLIPLSNYPTMKLAVVNGSSFMVGDKNGVEAGFLVTITIITFVTVLIILLKRKSKRKELPI
jgi:membrane protease YdiL (CAAX protease family)